MRLFVRAIWASAGTMLLDDGEGLAQRGRGAEKEGLSVTVIESPSGTYSSLSLSPSAPPRLCARFLLHGFDSDAVADQGDSDLGSGVATTAIRLVHALGSNPRLSSFLGQPWSGVSTPLALAGHEAGSVEGLPAPSAISASLREATL